MEVLNQPKLEREGSVNSEYQLRIAIECKGENQCKSERERVGLSAGRDQCQLQTFQHRGRALLSRKLMAYLA